MNKFPRISIITCSYNSNLQVFEKMLLSVKMQTYPKDKIEHLVMDGGSTSGTLALVKKYNCKIYSDTKLRDKGQARVSMGIKKARGDIVLILESDNVLIGKDWLKKMVQPFIENNKIFCTFSAYNHYDNNMPITTRYCALFGSSDPALYYLGKSEKIPLTQKYYNKGEIMSEKKNYYVVKFNKNNLPTIGDNGHMFLRRAINKVNKAPEKFIHVDAFYELLSYGYDTYGVVKNSITHFSNKKIVDLVKRRVEVKEDFYNGRFIERKYKIFDPNSIQDIKSLIKFIIFSLTFIIPFFRSLMGYLRIPDTAWFLHPIICFLMLAGYGTSEIKWILKKRFTII